MPDTDPNTVLPALPKKCVALVRLAPDISPAQRDEAIQQQESSFKRFCDRQHLVPAATFVDPIAEQTVDESTPSEAAYTRLRRYVSQDGGVAAVAMLKLETLADEPDERALYLLELEGMGTKVFLFNGQGVDPSSVLSGTWPTPAQTASDMGARIKTAMLSHAIRGEGLGKPPYGYRIGARKKLEVVPDEAENVRLIYSLYTQEDQGIRLIVRYLNEHSILTRKSRNWSMVTIRDILRNRAYLGTYTRFGMRVPGSHTPIITPEVFRWTQSRLEERQPLRREAQADPFLLSGLIYCGSCGNRMMGVTRRQSWLRQKDGSRAQKEYRYYQCQSRTNQGVCNYHTQNALELEGKVLEYLRAQGPRLAAAISRKSSRSALAALQRERRRLDAGLTKLDAKLRRNIKQVQAGKVSFLRFRTPANQLLLERRGILDRMDLLWAAEASGMPAPSPVRSAVSSIDELTTQWESLEFQRRRMLFVSLLDRVNVHEAVVDVDLRPELLP